MNNIEKTTEQRKRRLEVKRGVIRAALWIKVSNRKPTEDGSYVCLNDRGDYIIFDFRAEAGFNEWVIAWLEEC